MAVIADVVADGHRHDLQTFQPMVAGGFAAVTPLRAARSGLSLRHKQTFDAFTVETARKL
jgi:hypothetical protein